jgi:hypothetical protein
MIDKFSTPLQPFDSDFVFPASSDVSGGAMDVEKHFSVSQVIYSFPIFFISVYAFSSYFVFSLYFIRSTLAIVLIL